MVKTKKTRLPGRRESTDLIGRIPKWAWLLISLAAAVLVWNLLSLNPKTARSFPPLAEVFGSARMMVERGVLVKDILSSMLSVFLGFLTGFVISVPVAFLMAWYRPVRYVLEPWIQFIRNIPPLAYVSLVVLSAGVGHKPQIIIICLSTFLILTVTIFQGVINVDETLIKAAKVLGAGDNVILAEIVFPATIPFIITAIRLGISTSLTTLIAAESTGAIAGIGMRIRSLGNTYDTSPLMLYIIIVGIIGMLAEKGLKLLERRVTSWQEKREL